MQISLPGDLEQFIEDRIRSGQYDDASDVVSQALKAMRFQQEALPRGEALERLISEGQAEADRGELLNGEDVFNDLLARNAQRTGKA